MSIDAKTVAELRRRTGLPMMKCKQALAEAGGDIEKAADELRKQGVKAAEKVAHREFTDGLVFRKEGPEGVCAVSLLCQTDFVARSADFVQYGEELVSWLFDHAPSDRGGAEDLADLKLADGSTLAERQQGLALKIGENIGVGEFARFRPANGYAGAYVHHNGKVAGIVEIAGEGIADADEVHGLVNELGMQLTFHKDVKGLTRDDLDDAWVAKEREIMVAQAADMPADKRDKIAEGKLAKRLKEVVLLEQPFIKNDKESVLQHVQGVGKAIGKPIEVSRFARIAAGNA